MNKIKLPIKVIDKRRKDGFFGCSYYITVRFDHDNDIKEYGVQAQQYYDMEIGVSYIMTLHHHFDGLYYPNPEF